MVGVPEVITSFRIDLSQYPEGSNLELNGVSQSGVLGVYTVNAVVIDASAGTYALPTGLRLILPQDYNSVIASDTGNASYNAALIDSSLGNGVLKLPITAVSRDGSPTTATIE